MFSLNGKEFYSKRERERQKEEKNSKYSKLLYFIKENKIVLYNLQNKNIF